MSEALEAEVRSLQSQLRRMRGAQGVVVLALVAVGVSAAAKKPGKLQAQEIELVDAGGQVRATFSAWETGTTLFLTGSGGAMVHLEANDGEASLKMRTSGITSAAAVSLSADGTVSKLHLADPIGNPRVALGAEADKAWVRTIDATGLVFTDLGGVAPAP